MPDELSAYVYALHAPERNAHIQEINPTFAEKGIPGSCMTDTEAAAVMTGFSYSKKAELESVRSHLVKIGEERLNLLDRFGLEESESIEMWRDSYEYYVPLKKVTAKVACQNWQSERAGE